MHETYRRPGREARPVPPWILPVGAIGIWLATSVYSVDPGEQAVVVRAGRALTTTRGPGLHVGWPWPIDRIRRLRVEETKRVWIGGSALERALGRREAGRDAERLTGDRNLVLGVATAQYRVTDPPRYLFAARDAREVIRAVTASAITEVIARTGVDAVLTGERLAVQDEVRRVAAARLSPLGLGVRLVAVSLEGTAPPPEVADAFRDVTSAREDAQRVINEAEGYANRLLPGARGEARRVRAEAEADGAATVERATGAAERFTELLSKVAPDREIATERLVTETLEEVLPRVRQIVVDEAAKRLDLDVLTGGDR